MLKKSNSKNMPYFDQHLRTYFLP